MTDTARKSDIDAQNALNILEDSLSYYVAEQSAAPQQDAEEELFEYYEAA